MNEGGYKLSPFLLMFLRHMYLIFLFDFIFLQQNIKLWIPTA